MTETLRIATGPSDTTQALFDGSVTVDGFDTRMSTAPSLADVFRQLLDGDVDVSEFGLTFLLRAREAGVPLVAIPVFPTRVFRHSCVFVNACSGITKPEDLVGRRIGEFGVYGQDSGVWAKGALSDDFGFRPELNQWVIGGLDRPAPPFDFTTHPHPEDVVVEPAPEGRSLAAMLQDGELDALFTANVPQNVLDGEAPDVVRLFPDYETVERDWHRRTGIFPMMHAVALHQDLLEANPGLDRAVHDAFLTSKEAAADRYRQRRRLFQAPTMLPWASALFERNEAEFDADWWPNGVAANRTTLEAFLRYHFEQGLSARLWRIEELFSPALLDT